MELRLKSKGWSGMAGIFRECIVSGRLWGVRKDWSWNLRCWKLAFTVDLVFISLPDSSHIPSSSLHQLNLSQRFIHKRPNVNKNAIIKMFKSNIYDPRLQAHKSFIHFLPGFFFCCASHDMSIQKASLVSFITRETAFSSLCTVKWGKLFMSCNCLRCLHRASTSQFTFVS